MGRRARLFCLRAPTVSLARRKGTLIICVSAAEGSPDAPCEEHFGRAPFYILIDTDSGEWRAVENRSPGPCGGKEPAAIRILMEHGVAILITGRVGGTGLEALAAAGIHVFSCGQEKSVGEALHLFRAGGMTRIA